MFAQSKPYPEMIELVAQLKVQHGLKIAVVSNEARELNDYRIHKFKLDGFVDSFISSCFVHLRKPDADIFRLALDIAQTPARQVVYIENTPMFVQVAEGLGIRSILHTDYKSTVREAGFVRTEERRSLMKTANPCILTINGGSSSIKFAQYQSGDPLKRGLYGKVDRIGMTGTILTFHDPRTSLQESRSIEASDHQSAATFLIDWLEEQHRFRFGDGSWAPGGPRHATHHSRTGHCRSCWRNCIALARTTRTICPARSN